MTTLLRRWLRPAVPPATLHDKVRLCAAYERLGPNGREVLLYLADRLVRGHDDYGDFNRGRDYAHEAAEEYCDGAIYAARWALEQRKGGAT